MTERRDDFWFPAKRYGWGWDLPNRWQGWLVLSLYAALLAAGAVVFLRRDDVASFALSAAILTGVLVFICWLKGERPRWRWGDK